MREGTITLCLAPIEWELSEAGVSTGVKRLGGRVQAQEIRKNSRSRVVDGVDIEAGNFVRNTRITEI